MDSAIAHNPSDGAAYNDKSLCMIELGTIEGVEEIFNRGIEVEPDYATIYHNKGWFLNNMGRHNDALELFKFTLELEPGRAVTYENMANAYENLGQHVNAIRAYRLAIRHIDPSYSKIVQQMTAEIRRLENLLNMR